MIHVSFQNDTFASIAIYFPNAIWNFTKNWYSWTIVQNNAKVFPNHKKTINLENDLNVEKAKK